jgi:hypothetical protein
MKLHLDNNEDDPKPGPARSGDQGPGQNSPIGGKGCTATSPSTSPLLVEMATALRGQSITRPKTPKSMNRRHTLMDIYSRDPEVPYVKFETTVRDLVCSLIERQDRMNKELFLKINDLEYRVADFENYQNGVRGGK